MDSEYVVHLVKLSHSSTSSACHVITGAMGYIDWRRDLYNRCMGCVKNKIDCVHILFSRIICVIYLP
jgi:hypothetical protein